MFSPSGPWPWGELLITGPSVPAAFLIGTRWRSTISNGQSSCWRTGMWSWAVLPCHILSPAVTGSMSHTPTPCSRSPLAHPRMFAAPETLIRGTVTLNLSAFWFWQKQGSKLLVLSHKSVQPSGPVQLLVGLCALEPWPVRFGAFLWFIWNSGIGAPSTVALSVFTGCCLDYWWHPGTALSSGTELGTGHHIVIPWAPWTALFSSHVGAELYLILPNTSLL